MLDGEIRLFILLVHLAFKGEMDTVAQDHFLEAGHYKMVKEGFTTFIFKLHCKHPAIGVKEIILVHNCLDLFEVAEIVMIVKSQRPDGGFVRGILADLKIAFCISDGIVHPVYSVIGGLINVIKLSEQFKL